MDQKVHSLTEDLALSQSELNNARAAHSEHVKAHSEELALLREEFGSEREYFAKERASMTQLSKDRQAQFDLDKQDFVLKIRETKDTVLSLQSKILTIGHEKDKLEERLSTLQESLMNMTMKCNQEAQLKSEEKARNTQLINDLDEKDTLWKEMITQLDFIIGG